MSIFIELGTIAFDLNVLASAWKVPVQSMPSFITAAGVKGLVNIFLSCCKAILIGISADETFVEAFGEYFSNSIVDRAVFVDCYNEIHEVCDCRCEVHRVTGHNN